jgi:hypothetical protein
MKEVGSAITSWLITCLLTVLTWTMLPTMTDVSPGKHALDFLPWPPGIAIAIVAGATGGMLKSLFSVWNSVAGQGIQKSNEVSSAAGLISPLLGSLSGTFIFVFLASGLSKSLSSTVGFLWRPTRENYSIGHLVYLLTPNSPNEFAALVLYSMLAGFSFQYLPELLDGLRGRVFIKRA